MERLFVVITKGNTDVIIWHFIPSPAFHPSIPYEPITLTLVTSRDTFPPPLVPVTRPLCLMC